MRKKYLLIILLSISTSINAQIDSIVSVDFGGDFMSSFIWRGSKLSSSPAIQPNMNLNIGNFSIGAWASWQLSDYWHETDLCISYENDFLMLGVIDYFTVSDFYSISFFNYQSGQSAHILEAFVGFPGNDKIPFQIIYSNTFFGDLNDDGEEYYSGFLELAWLFSLKETDAMLKLGLSPYEGMYADKAAIVETAFCLGKSIKITDGFSINAQSQLVLNPYSQDIFLVFGIGTSF